MDSIAVMQSPPGAETVIDGRPYLYFGGTGYLGLQGHPEVIRVACEAAQRYGIGSATARSGFGNTPPVLELEHQAALFLDMEDAFHVMSGYVANHVLVLALEGCFEAIFVDELAHYCIREAARLSGRPVHTFHHRDPEDLRRNLQRHLPPQGRPLVMTDGVFAALGRIAPVWEYRHVLAEYPRAILAVDDAHGLGVLGKEGRGTFDYVGLQKSVNASLPSRSALYGDLHLLSCGTLSKAVGGFGGIVPGSRTVVERLKASSPYYSGASATPVPVAAASARALQLMRTHPEWRQQLWENVRMVKTGLREMGLNVGATPVPILALALGSADNMQRIHRQLMERGILIPYMPTYSGLGPAGALRLAVFATHTEAMIRRLLEELGRLL
ncbi:MAG: pyridoxal phosphate-dependent aminotransferase family protein [Thermoguttaceae bacterium]